MGRANTHDKQELGRDYLAVARGSDLVVVRVVGAGNMLLAPALSDFAETQLKAGFRRFVFDLERCRGLDSTFMGVMVGLYTALRTELGMCQGQKGEEAAAASDAMEEMTPEEATQHLQKHFSAGGCPPGDLSQSTGSGSLSAVNISPEIRNVMTMLGVDKFVRIRGSCDLTQLETTILPEKNLPPDERRRLILKAHQNLVEIDKRNEAQFGAFLKTLSKELAGN